MKFLSFYTLLLAAFLPLCTYSLPQNENTRLLIHTLNYLATDYGNAVSGGKVISTDEYAEMLEFSQNARLYYSEVGKTFSGADSAAVANLLLRLDSAVASKQSPEVVADLSSQARQEVVRLTGFKSYPTVYPNMANGQKVYAAECAKCHGAEGKGDGPEGATLNPAPRNFYETERVALISPAHAFNTIRLGVEGTGMRAHPHLSDKEVWDLAFYVLSMRYTATGQTTAGKTSLTLEQIATLSDRELATQFSLTDNQIAAVRLHRPTVAKGHFLQLADEYLQKADEAYAAGKNAEALRLASFAYLEGVEPVEMSLRATDPQLAEVLEKQLTALRKLMQERKLTETVSDSIAAARVTIAAAGEVIAEKQYSVWMALFMTISILLREGLEAFLVIMVLLSILKASSMPASQKWIHVGWISAVLTGIAMWFVSGKLLPEGVHMELVEAIVSFVAVAMLLYIGFWLHSKTKADEWRKYVSGLVKTAVNSGSVWGLTALSFFVTFREVFESVLFLSALNIESGGKQSSAIAIGVLIATVIVLVFAWLVLRYSARLPIPKLFNISSLVMAVLAVVLAGKGTHSLQEVGMLPIHGISFIRIELLGIYPTMETCGVQLLTLGAVWLIRNAATLFKSKPQVQKT